ncbi:MAG: HlyC/CorC family transporter [Verrucomicrobiales bacterium]|nr:HlyC/CorC family transporter [Verrucomicrobiales bacterium]
MEWPVLVASFVLLALGGLAFLCSAAETALFSLGRWQSRRMNERGGTSAMAARLLEHPEEVLAALSLVNTVANGMVVVTCLLLAKILALNLWVMLAAAFLGVLILGELLPKTLAVRAPEEWSARVAPAVALLQWITRPVRRVAQRILETTLGWVLPASAQPLPITDDEYRELLEMGVQQGALGRSEKEIIAELITLDRKHARDVMRPRATLAAVSDDLSPDELAAEARRIRQRRIPVYDETPDTIVGVLNAQQFLLDPHHRLEDSLEFPSFVPETINLLQLFQALQRQRRSLALVLDEFGAVAGIVRMEDILGEVLGEMSADPTARALIFERRGVGKWRASGSMRLDDFRREFPSLPEVPGVETLGGLLMAQLDIVPPRGATAVVHGLRLTAEVVDERRVHEVLVERVSGR